VILWLIGGGLFLVGLGIFIGYRACADISGRIFQALYDEGLMIIKTEDGKWQASDKAKEWLKSK
jgi:hypothetical protein